MNHNSNKSSNAPSRRMMNNSEVSIQRERESMPKNYALAMAYVPFQMWSDELYELDTALEQGTIFPELDKPFLAGRGGSR